MPTWDEGVVAGLASRLRLGLDPRRNRSVGGARLAPSPGASLEFHDHRSYQPGDDLRHLDWGVYARTDQLVLRRHQREVSPQLTVLLDLSASMGLTDDKAAVATGLAALVMRIAEAEGAQVSLWILADRAHPLDRSRAMWPSQLAAATPSGAPGLECSPPPRLPARSERVVISDGLCPGGGPEAVRRLGRDAGSVTLVEVMTREERDPTAVGPVRLEDMEGGALDMVLDVAACAAYRERLTRHRSEWQAALHGRGAGLVPVTVEDGLEEAAFALVAAGLLGARFEGARRSSGPGVREAR